MKKSQFTVSLPFPLFWPLWDKNPVVYLASATKQATARFIGSHSILAFHNPASCLCLVRWLLGWPFLGSSSIQQLGRAMRSKTAIPLYAVLVPAVNVASVTHSLPLSRNLAWASSHDCRGDSEGHTMTLPPCLFHNA
jgi:hypothetical protein